MTNSCHPCTSCTAGGRLALKETWKDTLTLGTTDVCRNWALHSHPLTQDCKWTSELLLKNLMHSWIFRGGCSEGLWGLQTVSCSLILLLPAIFPTWSWTWRMVSSQQWDIICDTMNGSSKELWQPWSRCTLWPRRPQRRSPRVQQRRTCQCHVLLWLGWKPSLAQRGMLSTGRADSDDDGTDGQTMHKVQDSLRRDQDLHPV